MAQQRKEPKYSEELKYQYSRIILYALKRYQKGITDPMGDAELEDFANELGAEVYQRVWVKKNGQGGISLKLPAPIQLRT